MYAIANRDKVLAYNKMRYQRDKEKRNQLAYNWVKNNREGRNAIERRNYKKNRHRAVAKHSNRRARRHNLPDTFAPEQWLACLEYFNYTCPVCDSQLRDLFGNVVPHADHWIPLSYEGDDNPGTVVENMVCLCSICNSSKGANMPYEWLVKKFGKRKATEIEKRINVYFEEVISAAKEIGYRLPDFAGDGIGRPADDYED